jgi:hypothetical protein
VAAWGTLLRLGWLARVPASSEWGDRLRLQTVMAEATGGGGQIDGFEADFIGDDGIRV